MRASVSWVCGIPSPKERSDEPGGNGYRCPVHHSREGSHMGRRFTFVAVIAAAGASLLALPAVSSAACKGVPSRSCLLPFPNDYAQTKADKTTQTKRRVNFARAQMPKTKAGK